MGSQSSLLSKTGVLGEASAPSRPGLHGSKERRYVFDVRDLVISSLEVWFDESFGTNRCVDGQDFGRFWRSQEIDRDQSEHITLSRLFLAFERSRSDEDWLRW